MTLFICAAVRRRLQAYHDRELPIRELFEIEDHVRGCARCTEELYAMRAIGDALRVAVAAAPADDWTGLQWGVIGRMRAEEQESWTARASRMFDDMHLIWIGLAATMAAVVCGAVALGALHFASTEREDSLAAMMAIVSAPSGSNLNPVRSNHYLQVPSVPMKGAIEHMLARPVSGEELMLAFSAVVTREGRLAGVSVLNAERPWDDIMPVLDVLSHASLEPGRVGTSPVAVNLIWLMAHTTVRPKTPPQTDLTPGRRLPSHLGDRRRDVVHRIGCPDDDVPAGFALLERDLEFLHP
jgi:hypothetical protein